MLAAAFSLAGASAHAVTIDENANLAPCIYPNPGPITIFCVTVTSSQYLSISPERLVWTPATTLDFYDNVTGNHFTGSDPGTLDVPL